MSEICPHFAERLNCLFAQFLALGDPEEDRAPLLCQTPLDETFGRSSGFAGSGGQGENASIGSWCTGEYLDGLLLEFQLEILKFPQGGEGSDLYGVWFAFTARQSSKNGRDVESSREVARP